MQADAADTKQMEQQAKPFVYDAFISYDHDDRPVARGIQRGLHHIGKRLGQLHALRVFRDSTDLSASPDLWGKVVEAMDGSRYMIVVLSPEAVASAWVNKEVDYWLANRGPGHLLFVVAAGSLTWDDDQGRFDRDRSDAALAVLTQPGVLPSEPLYVDVSEDAPWDPGSALFREKVTDLAAPIHGKPKYELASEDLREQRKFRRLRRYAIAALVLLTIIAVVAAAVAAVQRGEAERQRDAAEARFKEATAARLSIESQAMLTGARARDDVRAIQEALASQRVAHAADTGALIRAVGAASATRKIIRVAAPLISGLTVQIDPQRGLDTVTSVAVTPDGSRIATGGLKARLWSTDSGQPVSEMFGFIVTSVAFSPDGRRVAAGGGDNTVGLWDAETGASLGSPLTGHTAIVTAVSFSPDGQRLVSAAADGTVRLWDADGHKALAVLTREGAFVNSVGFSPDGRRVVSAGKDGVVRVVDVDTRAAVKTWTAGAEVTSVAFGPNNRVVAGDSDGHVRVYNAGTGEEFEPLPTGSRNAVQTVALSPDGHLVAFGGFDQNIQIWDVDTRSPVRRPLVGHTGWVASVVFTHDGSRIVSASYDGTVRIWDAEDRGSVGKVVLPNGWQGRPPPVPRSVALAPDSHHMVAGFPDGTLSVFETDTGRQVGPTMTDHVGRVTVAGYSPDGRRIATGGDDGTVHFWDVASGSAIRVSTERTAPIVDLLFSPDGKRVAAQIEGGMAQLWDPGTGQPVGQPLTGHSGEISGMSFSPDGRRLVTGGDDSTVRLWDTDTGAPIGDPLTGHERRIYRVAFGDNGRTIISLSAHSLRLWDTETRAPIGAPHYPDPDIFVGLAASPDGRFVVTSGFGVIQRWNAATGDPIGPPMHGHTALVPAIGVSRDGRYIVSGGDDRTVRFWDAGTGDPVGDPLPTPDVKMGKLWMSRDDRRILIFVITPTDHVSASLWPGPASWRDDLCSKLSANMSPKQWDTWISPAIDDVKMCPNLPDLPDDAG